jgi:hypothetical protein
MGEGRLSLNNRRARRAEDAFGLRTRLTSIDPEPRNDVDKLCDEVIRQPLERSDVAMFETLGPGEIVFLDSSDRAFQGCWPRPRPGRPCG